MKTKEKTTGSVWEPSAEDIEWQRRMLAMGKDQFVWGVPCTESVFFINKPNKTIRLAVGDSLDETNLRIVKVFGILGYKEE